MLSFLEPSRDWPLTTGGLAKSFNLSQYRRSMSVPSSYCSDSSSDNSSPVDDMKFEQVFIPEVKVIAKKVTTENKKKMMSMMNKDKSKEVENKTLSKENESKTVKKKKKRKWKQMNIEDLGFNTSMLPRPCKSPNMNDEEVHKVLDKIDEEYLEMEEKVFIYEHLYKLEGNRLENRYIRLDRDRKIRKAHKQVKDKYCKNLKNNDGRKKLYVHHRVYWRTRQTLLNEKTYFYLPGPSKKQQPDFINSSRSTNHVRAAPVQNLAHALHSNGTAAGDLPTDLISLLITLQHRDLSPEDYEVLLRLDESVAPKTVSENILKSFRTDIVDDESAGEICPVCMDPYVIGQSRKFLPCDHVFHDSCIDMWLKNSSMNCPLDNLPVDS